jgi:Flp pilus assembly protein TadG
MAMALQQRLSALRRRMRADATRGSAAIEFAFVAPAFFVLLMGIMEVGIMFFGQFTMQNAVMTAGRLIRVGTAQATAYGTAAKCTGGQGGSGPSGAYASAQEWFKDQICCGISGLLDCTNLHVSVQSYSGGFGTGFTPAKDSNGLYTPVTDSYSPGVSCDVVLVRATYTWKVQTPGTTWFLVNMANSAHMINATSAFRNEPYAAGTTC